MIPTNFVSVNKKRNKMKTTTRNFIASLVIGTSLFSANAEIITSGIIQNSINQQVISYNVHHLSCANANDGSIDIEVVAGTTYFFSWENGNNEQDINNLAAGIYRVKIETNEGEIIFSSFEITSPSLLQGVISQNDLQTSVNLDLLVQGGTAPYNYTWTTQETSEDILGITTEGIYEVNITDVNGCQLNIGTYVYFGEAGLLEQTNTVKLYPNPNNGNGTISWDNADIETIEITTGTGQLVNSIQVKNLTSLSFDNLSSGMYVANLISAEEKQSIQFIVQ